MIPAVWNVRSRLRCRACSTGVSSFAANWPRKSRCFVARFHFLFVVLPWKSLLHKPIVLEHTQLPTSHADWLLFNLTDWVLNLLKNKEMTLGFCISVVFAITCQFFMHFVRLFLHRRDSASDRIRNIANYSSSFLGRYSRLHNLHRFDGVHFQGKASSFGPYTKGYQKLGALAHPFLRFSMSCKL